MLKHCWGQTKQVVCLEVSLWLWIPASSPRTSKDWGSRRLLGIPSWTDPGDCGAETPEGKRCWLLLRCFTITVHVWSGETAYTLIQYFPLSDTHYLSISTSFQGFSGGSNGKESACNAGDLGSIPEARLILIKSELGLFPYLLYKVILKLSVHLHFSSRWPRIKNGIILEFVS